MRFHKRHTVSSRTPPVPGRPAKPSTVTPSGKMIPATPAVPSTPGTGTTTTTYTSINTPKPGIPGGVMSGAVLLLGIGLIYATSTTNKNNTNIWSFLFDPSSKVNKTQINQSMSMVFLVIVMALFADMSPAIGAMSVLVLTGFWIVWAVENPDGLSLLLKNLSFGTSGTKHSGISNATTAGATTL